MAILFLEKQHISRKKGDSVCAAAAYRCGGKIKDYFYGETHDYSNRHGVCYSEIITPNGTPEEYSNREALWNIVEHREQRKDARLAHELRLALPRELSLDEHIPLVADFVTENLVSEGACVDFAIHDKGDGNPHSHVMYTTRTLENGEFGNKNRNFDKREFLASLHEKWGLEQGKRLGK